MSVADTRRAGKVFAGIGVWVRVGWPTLLEMKSCTGCARGDRNRGLIEGFDQAKPLTVSAVLGLF
jgi:hypothetical protein